MAHLAGSKIRAAREARGLSRAAFGALYGVAGPTVAGWETNQEKVPASALMNRMAREGLATHADWHLPATCPRCARWTSEPEAANCTLADCPVAVRPPANRQEAA